MTDAEALNEATNAARRTDRMLGQVTGEVLRLRATVEELTAALEEMLAAHSMENVGLNPSLRRIEAKKAARAALALAKKGE